MSRPPSGSAGRRGPLRSAALLVATLPACSYETYDVADLQIDVAAPLPVEAETLRLCVSDHGSAEVGAGNGRMAFPGIRSGAALEVTLDVYDTDAVLLASAGPVALDADAPWTRTPLLAPGEPCTAGGGLAQEGSDTWLLALRFEE